MLSGISYENRRYSFKGGVVKSTFSLHLAGALAQKEPTLLVDADPQRSIMAVNRLKERDYTYQIQEAPRTYVEAFLKGGGVDYCHRLTAPHRRNSEGCGSG